MTDIDHSQRAHAVNGPSGIKSIHLCSGYEGKDGTNAAAEMGTRIHEAAEVRDPSGLQSDLELDIYEQLLRDEDAVLDEVFGTHDRESSDMDYHPEIRLEIPAPGARNPFFGTADVVAVTPEPEHWKTWTGQQRIPNGDCVLLDYKTGIGEVDAPPGNWQSKSYAIGVFDKFPWVSRIHAAFSIPQLGQLLRGVYLRTELDDMRAEVGAVLTAAERVQAKWVDGQPELEDVEPNAHCRFCKHELHCPALGFLSVEVAKANAADGTAWLPEGGVPVDTDDPEVLAKWLPVAKVAESWGKALQARAKEVAMAGTDIPGHALRSMGSSRKVADVEQVLLAAMEVGISERDVLDICNIPVGKLLDLAARDAERGEKGDAITEFEDRLGDALEKQSERFSLKAVKQ